MSEALQQGSPQPRISAALALLVGTLMFFAILVLAYYGTWVDWQMEKRLAFARAERACRSGVELQSSIVQSSKILLDSLAITPVARYGSSTQLRELFKSILPKHDQRYSWWMMLKSDGTLLAGEGEGLDTLLSSGWLESANVVVEARLTKRFSIGQYFKVDDGHVLPMAMPVSDGSGRVVRYLLAAWDVSVGEKHLGTLLDKDDRVCFISTDNKIVLHYPLDHSHAADNSPSLTTLKAIKGLTITQQIEVASTADEQRFVNLQPVFDDNKHLLVHVAGSVASPTFLDFVHRRYSKQLLSFFLMLVCAIPLTWWFCRKYIVLGLHHLTSVAQRTSAGELSVRNKQVPGCQEIQTLAYVYDSMLDALESHTRVLADREQRLTLALEASQQGVWTWRASVPCFECDARLSTMLGYHAPVCLRPEDLYAQIHPDDRSESLLDGKFMVLGDAKDYRQELRMLVNNNWLWFQFNGRIHNETNNFFGTAMDITRRRKADEIIRSDAERYKRLSNTDPLTGLWNRRYFVQTVSSEMRRSRRYERPYTVGVCDLDFFKRVNDTYGHDGGDAVLVSFARLLLNNLRESDVVARTGGEEFAFFLPETDLVSAHYVFDKLRVITADTPILFEGHSIHITVSCGIASYAGQGEEALTYPKIMRMADEALYRAKDSGRNCIRY